MEHTAIFLESSGTMEINRQTAPEFLLLYQQAVLLALREQGVLDDAQYDLCLEALSDRKG